MARPPSSRRAAGLGLPSEDLRAEKAADPGRALRPAAHGLLRRGQHDQNPRHAAEPGPAGHDERRATTACGPCLPGIEAAPLPARLRGASAPPVRSSYALDEQRPGAAVAGAGWSGMKLLVLGGTHHVGRAVVETALARGDEVTTLNRGVSGHQPPGARALHADRTDPAALRAALSSEPRGDGTWDAVIDTWSGAPRGVADAAGLLADRATHYGYVSSRSVYRWPFPVGGDESAPVVDGDPAGADGEDYATAKRGGELAAAAAFGDRALLARAGPILGPYENVGGRPWWVRGLGQGGHGLAPGPPRRAPHGDPPPRP